MRNGFSYFKVVSIARVTFGWNSIVQLALALAKVLGRQRERFKYRIKRKNRAYFFIVKILPLCLMIVANNNYYPCQLL